MLLSTSLYQPLDAAHRFFVEPRVAFSRSLEDVFHRRRARGALRVPGYRRPARCRRQPGPLRAGAHRLPLRSTARSTSILVPAAAEDQPEWMPACAFSRVRQSRHRVQSDARARRRRSSTRAATTRWAAIAIGSVPRSGVGIAVPFRRDVLWVTLAGGSDLGSNLPADRAFALGGPSSFPGFELGELRVDGYWTIGTSYLWKVKDVLPIRNLALYAGVRLEAGADLRSHRQRGFGGHLRRIGVPHRPHTGRSADGRLRHDIDRLVEPVAQRRADRSGTARSWTGEYFADDDRSRAV